jgi:hypothetical protein
MTSRENREFLAFVADEDANTCWNEGHGAIPEVCRVKIFLPDSEVTGVICMPSRVNPSQSVFQSPKHPNIQEHIFFILLNKNE